MGQKVIYKQRLALSAAGTPTGRKKANTPTTSLKTTKLREYLNVRLANSSVSRIVIERTLKLITITVCTSPPRQDYRPRRTGC